MNNRRSLATFLALLLVLAAPAVFPDSSVASALRYLAFGYIAIDWTLRAREGYVRRRPHWTPESWRGYRKLCLIPAGAFLMLAGMVTAIELRLPIAGASRSTPRMLWALGTIFFLLVFAAALAMVIERLREGEASRQFEWPRWLGGTRA